MDRTAQHGAALMECIAPLDKEDRRALRRYWERVIREEWVPPVRRVGWAGSADVDGPRRRREARRAMARVATAGRLAAVVALPTSPAADAGSGVAA